MLVVILLSVAGHGFPVWALGEHVLTSSFHWGKHTAMEAPKGPNTGAETQDPTSSHALHPLETHRLPTGTCILYLLM